MTDSEILLYLNAFVEEFESKKMTTVRDRFIELLEEQKDAEHYRRWIEMKKDVE